MSCGRGGTIRELLSEIADLRAAERRVIALLSDERQANADLRTALAQSEASQRALRSALEWWCAGPGLYDGWRCSRCNARADTRDALLHAPDCLLAAPPPADAAGAP